MPSPLLERYLNLRPDARTGAGYGSLSKIEPAKPSVGTPMSMSSLYPYSSPDESDYSDAEEEGDEGNIEMSNKILTKIGGVSYVNDPFGSNWTDRGAFVNWATRLDLYEGSNFSIKDIDFNASPAYSRGGISQIYAMGNGAGIYKTKSGRYIGMDIGGRPQSYAASKTDKKIPPSLVDFITQYVSEDDEQI